MTKKHLLIGLGLTMAAGGLAGCASTPKTADKKPAPQAAAQTQPQEEYVAQTSLGSWIPKKVKKSQTTTSDQDSQSSQQAMRDLQQRTSAGSRAGN